MDSKELSKKLYALKFNECLLVDLRTYYRRVPGGWIVEYADEEDQNKLQFALFIEYHNEFQT